MKRSRFWTGIGLLLILPLAWAGCRFFRSTLHFSVIVEEAPGLEADRPVMLRGQQVGEVVSVSVKSEDETRIEVVVSREHRDEIYGNSAFRVADCPDGLPCLWVEDQPGTQTPVDDGEVIDLRPGWLERLSENLKRLGESAGETVDQLKSDVEAAVSNLKDSPEAQALKEGLVEFGQDVATIARGSLRRFVAEELPKLEKKAEAYREKLKKEGRNEEAEIFWKWFTRWADGMKKAAGELKAEAEPDN